MTPGRLWVGIGDEPSVVNAGIVELKWDEKAVKKVDGPEHKIRAIVMTPGGQVFAASWWSLYQTRGPAVP
jgi:hypothetical protein